MQISIIHPSRGRAAMAQDACRAWLDKCSNVGNIEYILSLDYDDKENQLRYYNLFFEQIKKDYKLNLIIEFNYNRNVVDAMNAGAAVSKGDLLVCISDDFDCPLDWDKAIITNIIKETPCALGTIDGIKKDGEVLTLPILNRLLYNELGYIYFPEYTGLFADNDLAELCITKGYYNFTTLSNFRETI